jgi:hypothetical protein
MSVFVAASGALRSPSIQARAFKVLANLEGRSMRFAPTMLTAAGCLGLALTAFAQSTAPTPVPATPAVQSNPAAAAPVSPSKRYACRAAAQAAQGQERADQMQLCIAQARLECLKQAIDQKIVGRERRDFIQTCLGQ